MELLSQLLSLSKQHSLPVIILLCGVIASGAVAGLIYLDAVETVLTEQEHLTARRAEIDKVRAEFAEQRIANMATRSAADGEKLKSEADTAIKERNATESKFAVLEATFHYHLMADLKLADQMVANARSAKADHINFMMSSAMSLRDGVEEAGLTEARVKELEHRYQIRHESEDLNNSREKNSIDIVSPNADEVRHAPLLDLSQPRHVLQILVALSILLIVSFSVLGVYSVRHQPKTDAEA